MPASAKQAITNSYATVFSQGRNNHAPSQKYAAIHALQLHSMPEASSYSLFKWLTPGPMQ